MSTLTSGKNFSYLQWLEQNLFFKNFSLNYCYYNNSISNFFYFNITSYIFIIFFSYSLILLSALWSRSKEKMGTACNFVYWNNHNTHILINYPYLIESSCHKQASKKICKELWNIDCYRYLSEVARKTKRIKINHIFWWEPWSFEILAYFPPFSKKFFNSPWHFYYKYRLSSWIRWHILEDRICIFVLLFLWILI